MSSNTCLHAATRLAIASLVVILLAPTASAQHEQAFIFNGSSGSEPQGGLISDSEGNLYGTTLRGGLGGGTVFEMSRSANGVWTETVLFNFNNGNTGATWPVGNLVFDNAGNLYGVTTFGCGAVFQLSPPTQSGGQWSETTLWSFSGGTDGCVPLGITIDQAGNLYGTAMGAGDCAPTIPCGVVFGLFESQGAFQFQILYSFGSQGEQGGFDPMAPVTLDAQGNLYGTTWDGGGIANEGVVFELSPSPDPGGEWIETVLHSFAEKPSDGIEPIAGLVFGPNGSLVGTTLEGGEFQGGTIFGLRPPPSPGGQWGYRVLYSFGGTPGDGTAPYSGLTLQSPTIAYGTTAGGGSSNAGTVYQFTQTSPNSWTETPLYNFTGGRDGGGPLAGVWLQNFALYGTTSVGGVNYKGCPNGCGTAFRLSR